MTALFWGALAALLAALGVVFWRYRRLQNELARLHREVRQQADRLIKDGTLETRGPEIEEAVAAINFLLRSARRQTAALESERARLSAVLEQIADAVLLVAPGGQVTYANAAANHIFNEHAPLTGRSLARGLRHHRIIAAWQEALETGEMVDTTLTMPRGRRVLRLIAVPDQAVAGGALLLVQDVTRLRHLEQMRRNFISNFSHELRTPLAALKALAETLQDGALEDPPAARRFLERIGVEVDALTQMSQELLDLTRIESGDLLLERKDVSPGVLLHDAAARMHIQAQRAGLRMHIKAEETLPKISVDRARISQALLNLIHNAIKFTPRGGEITLETRQMGEEIWLVVQDTGVGIPAEELPRIFERFYKVERARNSSGTGLGLAIVQHIVGAHGGRVWAESTEGHGSAFFIAIPI